MIAFSKYFTGYDEYYKKINWKTVRLVYYPFPIRGAFL
jgi:hypothetical protein